MADYSQAFDRISKDSLEKKEEEKKGFGPDFLQWVRALMSDTKSWVNYCGWLSDFIFLM